ncbi:hypothetical protein AVEN_190730-1 [Araneus ventricosus]|uniref:Uncharacterized protein n=1 Tax=Araneus ventricosus TaxID=182803 RepID=A0A4Y2MQU9_ARAVE|nr:hypothetical protein AVEN_190730-1 [Araneus ventricosus]
MEILPWTAQLGETLKTSFVIKQELPRLNTRRHTGSYEKPAPKTDIRRCAAHETTLRFTGVRSVRWALRATPPLLDPPGKREPAYLSGCFSSVNSRRVICKEKQFSWRNPVQNENRSNSEKHQSTESMRCAKSDFALVVMISELLTVTVLQEQFLSNHHNKVRRIAMLSSKLEGEGF